MRCDALAADTDGVQRQCEPEALRSRSLHQAALTPQSQTGQAIAPAPVNRREFVLHSVLAPALALALAGSGTEDPVTVLNRYVHTVLITAHAGPREWCILVMQHGA